MDNSNMEASTTPSYVLSLIYLSVHDGTLTTSLLWKVTPGVTEAGDHGGISLLHGASTYTPQMGRSLIPWYRNRFSGKGVFLPEMFPLPTGILYNCILCTQ